MANSQCERHSAPHNFQQEQVHVDKDQVGPVLGRIPSGLTILTAQSPDGDQTGMLASWVQQASFEPPALTVAVNTKRYLNDWLVDGSTVALSLVGESQKQFLGHFGKGFEPGEPAFEGLSTELSPSGLTVLSDALGWLEGTVTGSIDGGDHRIYVVEITAGSPGESLETEKPFVHIRKNGFGY
jgi:flavin reductase (DIM6/NTAB) family NADH-FMN oxidoreductase RutF